MDSFIFGGCMIDREKANKVFDKYVSSFDMSNKLIYLKHYLK